MKFIIKHGDVSSGVLFMWVGGFTFAADVWWAWLIAFPFLIFSFWLLDKWKDSEQ